ncbi:hypothetical protein CsSME_00013509 [Camellia sinensis var. sinensis]
MKLKKKDLLGASDPYVKLKLTEDKLQSKKTTVKHKKLNPEWNEEFNLVIKDPESQALEIHVYDWEQVYFALFFSSDLLSNIKLFCLFSASTCVGGHREGQARAMTHSDFTKS